MEVEVLHSYALDSPSGQANPTSSGLIHRINASEFDFQNRDRVRMMQLTKKKMDA